MLSFTEDLSKAGELPGYEPKLVIKKTIDEFLKLDLNGGRSKTIPE
jgi:hypothetical protein